MPISKSLDIVCYQSCEILPCTGEITDYNNMDVTRHELVMHYRVGQSANLSFTLFSKCHELFRESCQLLENLNMSDRFSREGR